MASIYKRGKTWWARAQRDGVEFRRSLGTTSRNKAVKEFSKWLDRLEQEIKGEHPRITFRSAMTLFLEQHCPTLKPGAAARYRQSGKAMFPHFQDLYLDEINKRAWADYVAARRAAGVSPASINRDRACLSKMFTVNIDAGLLEANPVRSFRPLREPDGRVRFLTKDEYQRILDAAPEDMRPIIIVAVNTGMRLNEILTLAWAQVDFDRAEIHLSKTKTGEPRVIPMPAVVSAQIRAQSRRIDPYVFKVTKSTRPVVAVSQRFARIAAAAKVSDFSFHDLRHTFASWATKGWHDWQDRPMRRDRLQVWMGHKSPLMTQRYAHLETEDLHSEMKAPGTNPGTDATDFSQRDA